MSTRPEAPITLILVLVAAATLCIPFHIRPENFVVDDGYFYPQIARYIARGQGSTFNGIMPTNGYHPLWMVICVLAALVTEKSLPLLQLLTFLQDLLTLASLAIVVRICQAAGKRGAMLACAPILLFATVLGIWRLLEANLALILQLFVLVVVIPLFPTLQHKIGRHKDILLGFLLGLTVLSRLDLVFFVVLILAYQLLRGTADRRPAFRLKSVLIQILVLLLVILPYLLSNILVFHHLQPVSGAIKSTFPRVHPWRITPVILPVVIASLINSLLFIKKQHKPFDTICLLTTAAAILHLIFSLSFGDVAPWYLTTGYLSVCFCIVWVYDAFLRPVSPLRWLEPALAAALFAAFMLFASLRVFSNLSYSRLRYGMFSLRSEYREPKHELALKLRAMFPANSRFYIFDAPGGVAYYSGMSLMPVDGLVADYQYNESLVQEGAAGYGAAHHIGYFIAPYVQPGQKYDRLFLTITNEGTEQVDSFQAPLTRLSAGTIRLDESGLLFRTAEINPELEASFPEVGVWRINQQDALHQR